MPVGLVGGATKVHPTAQAALKILGVTTAAELAGIIVAVGLAQNFGALKALATVGIQRATWRCTPTTSPWWRAPRARRWTRLAAILVEKRQVRQDVAGAGARPDAGHGVSRCGGPRHGPSPDASGSSRSAPATGSRTRRVPRRRHPGRVRRGAGGRGADRHRGGQLRVTALGAADGRHGARCCGACGRGRASPIPCSCPTCRGFEEAVAAGAREVAVFAAASETFSRRNINCSVADSIERFRPVAEAAGGGRRPPARLRVLCAGVPLRGGGAVGQVVAVAETLAAWAAPRSRSATRSGSARR